MTAIRIKSITHLSNGITRIRHGKSEVEITGGKSGFRQWIRDQIRDNEDFLLTLALAVWIKRDPQLSTPDLVVGKTVTLDLAGSLDHADGIVRAV